MNSISKKTVVALFLISLTTALTSYSQSTNWVRTIKGQGFDDCNDLYSDAHGNVYVTGQIEFLADFGTMSLYSSGSHDIFVAKYDSSGNVLWAKRAGGSDGDIGHAIAVDSAGNVFITGEFESSSQFGSITLNARGDNDMFIAKYDSSGDIQWAESIGSNDGNIKGFGIACDESGNVYACGYFTGRAYHDGSSLFSSRGGKDILILKFDTHGDLLWDKQAGGSDSDEGNGIVVKDHFVYVTGSIEGNARFTSSVYKQSEGETDFFLAKYDDDGNFEWAETGGGDDEDAGRDVSININGDIICTGDFTGSAEFDNHTIHAAGNTDMFISVYDDQGNERWTKRAGGSGNDIGRNIAQDNKGNILIGGTYEGSADFDSIQISSSNENVFIAGYDSSGSILFARGFGGSLNDRGHGVGSDMYGNIYFAGEFRTSIQFDSISITGNNLYDCFIVRFGNYPICSDSITAQSASCYNVCDGSISVTPFGQPPYIFEWPLLPGQTSNVVSGLCVGDYPVKITDATGCVMNDTINISQPPELIFSGLSLTHVSCSGCNDGIIQLEIDGGIPPYTFLWSDGITSEDRMNIPSGDYSICVSDSNGCNVCDTFNIHYPLGMTDINYSEFFSVYPIPANGFITLNFSEKLQEGNYSVIMYNSIGKREEERLCSELIMEMDTRKFAAGMIFVGLMNLKTGQMVQVVPVVISGR